MPELCTTPTGWAPRPRAAVRKAGWLAAAAALALGAACAHVEAPPGGEPDTSPPQLETTRPDTFARLRSYVGPVIFAFNETVSEKGIDSVVTVSPRTSSVVAEKHGNEVRVELRRGWEPNRIYQVTLHAGVQDLFNNGTKEPVTVVFSTGPEIVRTLATGTVVERTTLRPAVAAVIEAVHRPDSVTYVTRPDSTGAWVLEYLPEGDYLVRAYNDTNKDQRLQPYEARDTVGIHVSARDTARARRLAVLAPDTSAPRAGGATGDSTLVEIRFDDYLDPAQPLAASQVRLTGPNGAVVAITTLRVGPFADVRSDSARADSAAADTGAAARRDTTPGEPLPSQSLFVRTQTPLGYDTEYTVTVTGVRNLVGLVGGGETTLRTPRAPPPPPAPAAGDSGRAVPRPPVTGAPATAPGTPVRPPAAPARPPAAPPTAPPSAPPAAPPSTAPRPVSSPAPVAAPPRGARARENRPNLPSF